MDKSTASATAVPPPELTPEVYAMFLMQALAYPPDPSTQSDPYEQKRYNLGLALYAGYIRYRSNVDKGWASQHQSIWVEPLLYSPKVIDDILRRVQKRFRERSIAGRMAMFYIEEFRHGEGVLPDSMQRLTLNNICRFVSQDAEVNNIANIKTRIWKPSLPVLHIAAALQLIWGDLAKKDREKPTHIFDLMMRPDVIEKLVLTSRECAYALIHGKAGIEPQTLLNLQDPPWVQKMVSKSL